MPPFASIRIVRIPFPSLCTVSRATISWLKLLSQRNRYSASSEGAAHAYSDGSCMRRRKSDSHWTWKSPKKRPGHVVLLVLKGRTRLNLSKIEPRPLPG